MSQAYDNYTKHAIKAFAQGATDLSRLKKQLSAKLKLPIPTNADIRERYESLVAQKQISRNLEFEAILHTRKIRTQSGVATVAVLTKPYSCPGKCLYCPTEKDMPKSYLSNEPAVMRAIAARFQPYRQVTSRLRSLELNGHSTEKIEIIVMGGTFSFLPLSYQRWFVKECFRACNEYSKKSQISNLKSQNHTASLKTDILIKQLQREQARNEKAKHRIVGLTLETRPDYITEKEIINFRQLGCTRVELGVQSIYGDVLKLNRRGHGIDATIRATRLLKDAGFKINYHMMPGLPGSTVSRDVTMFRALFSDSVFQPDMLKIYPTIVTSNSPLYHQWKRGDYKPLTNAQFERFLIKVKRTLIPPYVRISRIVRDVPTASIVAGPTISNLRQIIAGRAHCSCIRCREVRTDYIIDEPMILDRINYDASGGQEIFLQFTTAKKDKLFALLRLRIPTDQNRCHPISALRKAAIIREVHTYGKLTSIGSSNDQSPQHIGLGKKLVQEAERIAHEEYGLKKIVVISGVGVRGYYRKLGYRLQSTYMVKKL